MKKKFMTGLLLMALTAGGFSTFTSCKDTDEDQWAELNGQQVDMQALIKQLQDQIAANKAANDEAIQNLLDEIAGVKGQIPSDEDIKKIAQSLIKDWALKSELTAVDDRLKIVEEWIKNHKDSGSNCNCSFDADQVANLIAIAGQTENINQFFAEDGGLKDLTDEIAALKKALYGDDTNKGLVNTVAGLEEWFNNIGMTPAEFQENVKQGEWVKAHKDALEALEAKKDEIALLNKDALNALNTYAQDLSKINEMYNLLFPEGVSEGMWSYSTVISEIEALKNRLNSISQCSCDLSALQSQVNSILGRINEMVTSLILQASTNSIYGSLNTPFGVNSMVLASYYGINTTGITEFPISGIGAECNLSEAQDDVDWSTILNGDNYQVAEQIARLADNGEAYLGQLWFTVNPGTVNNLNVNNFALVNSAEKVSPVNLYNVTKDDETVLSFGVGSRAAGNGNGLYSAVATVAPDKLNSIKINLDSELKSTLADAVKNHTASDMSKMIKAIYYQLQNVCEANALRYSWGSPENKVYSNYGLAATAIKPLSFAALKDLNINRKFPTFGSIELSKDLVNLGLEEFKIGNVSLDIDLNIESIQIDGVGNTIITVKIPKQYDVNVDADGSGTATLPANWENNPSMYDTINVDITGDLQAVVDKIQDSIDEWIYGVPGNENKPGLNAQINAAIKDAVDKAFNDPETGLVPSIEDQVNGMMGDIQDKLDSVVDKINKDYLNKVNSLIDKYNNVAERINNALSNPNHYLQAMMLYRGATNGAGILSNDPTRPTQFKGNGEAIELWATTYNFETLCPSFKKIVGVSKVTKNGTIDCPELAAAANKTMAKVMEGHQNQVALDVKGATNGVYTYEIVYQALDYSGYTSTAKCYLQVIR